MHIFDVVHMAVHFLQVHISQCIESRSSVTYACDLGSATIASGTASVAQFVRAHGRGFESHPRQINCFGLHAKNLV